MRIQSGDPEPDLDLIERELANEAEKEREQVTTPPPGLTTALIWVLLLGVWALLIVLLVVLLA